MNPIFKEYCKFLKDTVNLELEEGYYWLDNQIIKALDKQGNIHKLYTIIEQIRKTAQRILHFIFHSRAKPIQNLKCVVLWRTNLCKVSNLLIYSYIELLLMTICPFHIKFLETMKQ